MTVVDADVMTVEESHNRSCVVSDGPSTGNQIAESKAHLPLYAMFQDAVRCQTASYVLFSVDVLVFDIDVHLSHIHNRQGDIETEECWHKAPFCK